MIEQRFLDYKQAAKYLALPYGTLRTLVFRREIPHVRITPRKVTFDRIELDRWLDARKVTP